MMQIPEKSPASARPTLLVANRGEIAVRIIRTARSEGYRTVAIYSEPDRDALHARMADTAVAIGGCSPQESYLDIGKILDAAQRAGANAVHPGYGFLSENADFARACAESGLLFVGPPAQAIEAMANKRRAKALVADAGVPCIPGFAAGDAVADDNDLVRAAEEIGYPLMIKAADGGGGRGMRLVESAEELQAHLRSARSEARSAFGSDEVILEKALVNARHVEVQVFADNHGNIVHLGERDCSVQRRHQKIVEESPSPAVDTGLRQRMGSAAIAAAGACDYRGAGTVEFLLDESGNFYFLEMNTRLQVEHPVTEMVTGLDLVAWQLSVARGEPLPVTQDEIQLCGHAIEVRLYAEDPDRDFLPQTGEVLHWRTPAGDGIRCDHAVINGGLVSPYYDPMLGKLITAGRDREQARLRMLDALARLELIGPKHNGYFLNRLVADPLFAAGQATTAFLGNEGRYLVEAPESAQATPRHAAIAVVLMHHGLLDPADLRRHRADWRSGDHSTPLVYRLQQENNSFECQLLPLRARHYRVHCEGLTLEMALMRSAEKQVLLAVDGVEETVVFHHRASELVTLVGGRQLAWRDCTHAPARTMEGPASGTLKAPMDGTVVELCVEQGQPVRKGDSVAVVEAMKMEHALRADCDGVIAELAARPGEQVRGGQLLVRIEPEAMLSSAEQSTAAS
ncbi:MULTISPECIES: ATP-binding protein [unclassified Microbulbifer]|uniref:ATP-binding protein n=1 Tax=unclassified Microbulbifer TaxID=2619833 RepID=UPI00272DCD41|nr:biotin carboxylase N-terminal domain-containing protein [Microbulbifer sp. YPW16]